MAASFSHKMETFMGQHPREELITQVRFSELEIRLSLRGAQAG